MPLKTFTYDDLLNGTADTDANYYLQSEVDEEIKRIVTGSISMFRDSACCRGLDLKSSLGKIADAAFKHYIRYDFIKNENKKLKLDVDYYKNCYHEYKRLYEEKVIDLCVEKTNVDTLEQAWKKSQRELWLSRAELCRRFNEDDYIRKHCNSIYWGKYFFFDEACKEMSLKLARAEQKCRDMMEKFK